ncbi:MAG: hypothetical protein AAGF91_10360 [Actinomycetota bacterium]
MNTIPATPRTTILLRISAALWLVWGAVHLFAGVITMARETDDAVAGIADAVDPDTLEMDYPDAVGAVVNQHGFNLAWIGIVTIICSVVIWRWRAAWAVFLAAIVGGLADVGYFIFLDLGDFVNFVPGTLMTLFSASAIITSFTAYFTTRSTTTTAPTPVDVG